MMRLNMACSRSEMVDRSKQGVRTNLGQRATTSQKPAPRVSAPWESLASGNERRLAPAACRLLPRRRGGGRRTSPFDLVHQLGKLTRCEHAAATREDAFGCFRAEHRLRKAQKFFSHARAIEGERGIAGNVGHVARVPRRARGNAHARRPALRIAGEQLLVRLDL